jgi:hypothetical protein
MDRPAAIKSLLRVAAELWLDEHGLPVPDMGPDPVYGYSVVVATSNNRFLGPCEQAFHEVMAERYSEYGKSGPVRPVLSARTDYLLRHGWDVG